MRPIRTTLALLVWLIASRGSAFAEGRNPYDEESAATYEQRVQMLSAQAKATLAILKKERFESVEIRMDQPYVTFEVLRKRLAHHGITVRLKHYGEKQTPGKGKIPLVNIPLDVFMRCFDQAVHWGWIVYPDGSITYFDNVCMGNEPKDGVFCHKSQFEAGKPEAMANDGKQRAANRNEGEQGVAPQSATRSESNSEGSDKPKPESKQRLR